MDRYLQTFVDRLTKQNKRSLSHFKDDLSLFYGTDDFVGHLGDLGSDAVSRSTVTRPKKNKHIMGITEIGNVRNYEMILIIAVRSLITNINVNGLSCESISHDI